MRNSLSTFTAGSDSYLCSKFTVHVLVWDTVWTDYPNFTTSSANGYLGHAVLGAHML